jgi:hypothetical protein
MVEIQVGGVGIKISAEEIDDTLHRLSSYLNRDRNSICLALSLINQNIVDWDSEINSFIVGQMAKNLSKQAGEKMTEEDIHLIFRTTLESPRRNAAAQPVIILQNIENQYADITKLAKKLDVQRITEIRYLIEGEGSEVPGREWIKDNASTPHEEQILRRGFMELARDDTPVYNFDNILKGFGGEHNAEELKNWLLSIEKLKYLIMQQISFTQYSLGCDKAGIDALREQLKRNNSQTGQ